MSFNHTSVLLQESIDSLHIQPGGVYMDGTAGGGGHCAAILEHLGSAGKLICVDQDPAALEVLAQRFVGVPNIKIIHNNFSNIKTIISGLSEWGVTRLDGLLLDIGVSSYQLDTAQRGFSYHADAPLDMRMSGEGMSARDVVNTYSEQELSAVIFRYGEEKFARSIAAGIVRARQSAPIETTGELVEIIKASMPAAAKRGAHPARRTFQAIRIEVNRELEVLEKALDDALPCMNEGGVISVITFHSLEDRLVKNKFREWAQGCTCPKDFPVCVCGKKPRVKVCKVLSPSPAEIENNNRSRSARLRSAIKCAE
ncbi:MAG: 16S rRNA (cytosine(1402)-N(4))-methyltransferase RsmH [Clostridia bacterium]|nr:16S rRNA (cytosine(1402)-N(4))-methyltransferase RsmH [Clostridia bacterium]